MCSVTLRNAVGNGSVTVLGSFENHAVGIRSHKGNWNDSLTLGKYEPDSAMVWLYIPCGSPGLILMTVQRHWELFKVLRGFPTNHRIIGWKRSLRSSSPTVTHRVTIFSLGRVKFFPPPVTCELYLAWAIISARIFCVTDHQGLSSMVQYMSMKLCQLRKPHS